MGDRGFGGGGGDSIFDDFYGGDLQQKKKEEEKKKDEVNKITVEESKIVEVVTLDSTQKGFSLLALIVMTENQDQIEKVNEKFKQLVANSLIIDIVQSVQYGSINKLKQSVELLIEKLEIDEVATKNFVMDQFKLLDNFNLFVSYMIEDQSDGAMSKVEEEALKLIDFIHSTADYPFITDMSSDPNFSFPIKKAISYLENLADSYMLVDYQQLGL